MSEEKKKEVTIDHVDDKDDDFKSYVESDESISEGKNENFLHPNQ